MPSQFHQLSKKRIESRPWKDGKTWKDGKLCKDYALFRQTSGDWVLITIKPGLAILVFPLVHMHPYASSCG